MEGGPRGLAFTHALLLKKGPADGTLVDNALLKAKFNNAVIEPCGSASIGFSPFSPVSLVTLNLRE